MTERHMSNDNHAHENEQAKLWAYYQNENTHVFRASIPRYNFILKQIFSKTREPSVAILNVGSGDGYFEKAVLDQRWQSYALDPDEQTVQRLKHHGIEARRGLIERMPFDNGTFNYVVASEVLEHLSSEAREKGLLEIFRVLKPGGWFLGTTPYKENLQANEVLCPHCQALFHRWGHRASFDLKAIRAELQAVFPRVTVRRRAFVSFRGRSLWRRVQGLVRLGLAQCGVSIAVPRIYFEAHKAGSASTI